jgi:hypothetical protein
MMQVLDKESVKTVLLIFREQWEEIENAQPLIAESKKISLVIEDIAYLLGLSHSEIEEISGKIETEEKIIKY